MADRRRRAKGRRRNAAPGISELAGALVEADRLLASIAEAVAECLARQRWADLEEAVQGYGRRLGVAPILVFDAALVRIYLKRALMTTDPLERHVCRSEIARLLATGGGHLTLADAIAEIQAAVRERDAADALAATIVSSEVH